MQKIGNRLIPTIAVCAIALLSILMALSILETRRACASRDPEPKMLAHAVLREQRAYHYEKGTFLSSFEHFKAEIDRSKVLLKKQNLIPSDPFANPEIFQRWAISIENHGNYTTVNVSPIVKNASSRTYFGVLSVDSRRSNYKLLMCSTSKLDKPLKLDPLDRTERKLVFQCPPPSREDC